MRLLLRIPLILAILVPFKNVAGPLAANGDDLPDISYKAFTAKIQAVMKKGTQQVRIVDAIERYDETQNKASMTLITGDKAAMTIMDYASQVMYEVEYTLSTNDVTSCRMISMAIAQTNQIPGIHDNFHIFGGWKKSSSKGGIPHMFSSKNMFKLNNSNPFEYKGPIDLDGVKAVYWTTTMKWSDDKDSFTVLYYFTQDNWAPAESRKSSQQLPLRIEVKGTKTENNQTVNIEHYYEYLDLAGSDRLASEAFDIPGGAVCKIYGDFKQKPLPKIPDVLSYSRETIDSQGNVDFADVQYDKNMGVMHIGGARGDIIYDFNSGVRYQIDDGKPCVGRAIDPELDSNSKMDGNYVKDIGPAEFDLSNDTLIFMGEGHSRQIGSNIYGSRVNGKAFDVKFGKKNWNFLPTANTPPLSMNRDGKHYNFFQVQSSAKNLRTDHWLFFCFPYEQIKDFRIVFFSKDHITPEEIFTDSNIVKMTDAISKPSGITSFQVQIGIWESFYDQETGRMTLTGYLYGQPPSSYMYRQKKHYAVQGNNLKTVQKKFPTGDYKEIIQKSADLCESKAASTDFKCRNFDLCKNSDNTFTMKMYETLPSSVYVAQSSSCDHFARSVDKKQPMSADAAMSNIKDAILKGLIYFEIPRSWGTAQFTAVEVSSNRYTRIKYDRSNIDLKFEFAWNTMLTNTEEVYVATFDDCARICAERGSYYCRGYRMCHNNNKCVLSADFPKKSTSKKDMTSPYCQTYRRLYVGDFNVLPGMTLQYDSPNVYKNVGEANECAAKCIENKKINCESFDYCADTKECLLSKTHVYSVPADSAKNTTPACAHFSKNYLLDFDIAENTALSSDDKHSLETIVVSAPEQCAYLCRTGYGGKGCVQFDYCSDKKQCQISSSKTHNYVAHVGKNNCDTFTLKDVSKAVASGELTGSKGTTYSNASFGGLAFAMILVGLAAGAGIIYILHKKRILHKYINS